MRRREDGTVVLVYTSGTEDVEQLRECLRWTKDQLRAMADRHRSGRQWDNTIDAGQLRSRLDTIDSIVGDP